MSDINEGEELAMIGSVSDDTLEKVNKKLSEIGVLRKDIITVKFKEFESKILKYRIRIIVYFYENRK